MMEDTLQMFHGLGGCYYIDLESWLFKAKVLRSAVVIRGYFRTRFKHIYACMQLVLKHRNKHLFLPAHCGELLRIQR